MESNPVIPINYQYELSSWILGLLKNVEPRFSEFLQYKKVTTQRKNFKLFTFSNLYVPQREIFADRLQVLSPEISFILSFYLDNIADQFIKDLFLYRLFTLGDKLSRGDFRVEAIESLSLPTIKETVSLKTLSPLLISKTNNKGNVDFLAPNHPLYEEFFLHNLLTKYIQVLTETKVPLGSFLNEEMALYPNFHRKIRSRLITIKAHTIREAKIRGFLFEFDLVAPKDVIELGLLTGFGEKNNLGFGACEIIG